MTLGFELVWVNSGDPSLDLTIFNRIGEVLLQLFLQWPFTPLLGWILGCSCLCKVLLIVAARVGIPLFRLEFSLHVMLLFRFFFFIFNV